MAKTSKKVSMGVMNLLKSVMDYKVKPLRVLADAGVRAANEESKVCEVISNLNSYIANARRYDAADAREAEAELYDYELRAAAIRSKVDQGHNAQKQLCYADKFYKASTLDVDAITEIAKQENVDFLITACTDQALLTVAKVSEILKLPCYIDYQTALNVTNKAYMKKVFAENNISTAKWVVMGELDEEKVADMPYPMIVKPADCNSSKGVKRVENAKELKAAFAEAVHLSRTNTVVVEQFIE